MCGEALTFFNLPQVLFALCVLGVRDMRFLWSELQKIAEREYPRLDTMEEALSALPSDESRFIDQTGRILLCFSHYAG